MSTRKCVFETFRMLIENKLQQITQLPNKLPSRSILGTKAINQLVLCEKPQSKCILTL